MGIRIKDFLGEALPKIHYIGQALYNEC